MITKEDMDRLAEHIGEKVVVHHVWYGKPDAEIDVLEAVNPFVNVKLEGMGIPFVGYGSAIQEIFAFDGGLIYSNIENIPIDYDRRKFEDINVMVVKSFGEEIAKEQREKKEQEDKAWEKFLEKSAKRIQGMSKALVKKGAKLIKSEHLKEWKEYVTKNTQDGYSGTVIEATVIAMEALTKGKSCKEADNDPKVQKLGITGYQSGAVAWGVSFFHPRGDEYKDYWNSIWLTPEEVKETKGVVNPAVLHIGSKKER